MVALVIDPLIEAVDLPKVPLRRSVGGRIKIECRVPEDAVPAEIPHGVEVKAVVSVEDCVLDHEGEGIVVVHALDDAFGFDRKTVGDAPGVRLDSLRYVSLGRVVD